MNSDMGGLYELANSIAAAEPVPVPVSVQNAQDRVRDSILWNEQLVANLVYGRREIEKLLADPRRDIEKECGHPVTTEISKDMYWHLFERDALGGRVVEVLAKESWQVTPKVYAAKNPAEQEQFDVDWTNVSLLLRGMKTWHKQEEGSLIWPLLKNADVLSGVGHFGIVLLGFSDVGTRHPITGKPITLQDPMDAVLASCDISNLDMDTGAVPDISPDDIDPELTVPATPPGTVDDDTNQYTPTSSYRGMDVAREYMDSLGGQPPKTRLMFVRSFPEFLVQITKYDSNPKSPRFTQPTEYMVTFNDPHVTQGGIGIQQTTKHVHWTRVLHLADTDHQASSDPCKAAPRLRPVVDRVWDARKLYGGSAEMYWRAAFPGLSFETIPQLGGNVRIDFTQLREMYERYINSMDRALYTKAMQVKTLAPTVVSPVDQLMAQIEAICIKIGCPKRVFMGTERGELASTQDDDAWNDRLKARQDTYITPHIIVPFIDRLIMAGVLTVPKNGYTVEWPDLTSKSDTEKADVGLKRAQALVAFLSGNGEGAMTFQDFLIYMMEMTEAEAKVIVENWEKAQAGIDTTVPDEGETATTPPSPATPPQTGTAEEDVDLSEYEDMFSEVPQETGT